MIKLIITVIIGLELGGIGKGEGRKEKGGGAVMGLATYLDHFFIDSFIIQNLTQYLTLPKFYKIFKIQIRRNTKQQFQRQSCDFERHSYF